MAVASKRARITLQRRGRRTRVKVRRRAGERHILSVFRSARHIYAQLSEPGGKTILGVSTRSKDFPGQGKPTGNVEAARLVGKLVAEKAIEKGCSKVVFNRNGYLYHGRIKALAEAAREAGLRF